MYNLNYFCTDKEGKDKEGKGDKGGGPQLAVPRLSVCADVQKVDRNKLAQVEVSELVELIYTQDCKQNQGYI